ncbi:MAG: hypothetical protein CMF22_09320 [Idiomarinaceae bacterium]|nr:hypothetical protein [Idiomarinaceae bacterium]
MKHFILATFVAVFAAGCASNGDAEQQAAATNDATAAETAETTETADAKFVCSAEHVVGTNFKRRRCRTKEQVAQDREDAQRELSEMQRSGMEAPIDN